MAGFSSQCKLPIYKGEFSFDETRLKELIKIAKPDYDPTDPRTWPLITSKYLENWLGMPYNGSTMLPPFVAYDRELVRSCLEGRTDETVNVTQDDGAVTTHSKAFHHFPFACAPSGVEKVRYVIGSIEYSEWKSGVIKGAFAKEKEDHAKPSVPMNTFNEILNMVKDEQAYGALESELAELRQRVRAAEKDKIETESRHKDERKNQQAKLKDALDRQVQSHLLTTESLRRRLWTSSISHVQERDRANAAEEKCQKMEKACADRECAFQDEISHEKDMVRLRELRLAKANDEVAAKIVALDAAEKEATILKEQMAKIRDEMKKAGYDGGQKRKSDDNVCGGQSKKTRTEG